MTGWRIGWLSAPVELGATIENLVQYSSSGTAVFMQRAATAALEQGEGFIATQVARAKAGRDIAVAGLRATGRVRFAEPDGAFYLFFSVDGEPDSRALAFRLIDEANVGLAPGGAFGEAGQGYLRLCYARDARQVKTATERLAGWLRRR
jgi:aspartate/methionine/tyrosine aminotransferase